LPAVAADASSLICATKELEHELEISRRSRRTRRCHFADEWSRPGPWRLGADVAIYVGAGRHVAVANVRCTARVAEFGDAAAIAITPAERTKPRSIDVPGAASAANRDAAGANDRALPATLRHVPATAVLNRKMLK
jgi:hypothetical protein